MCVCVSISRVRLYGTPWTVTHQVSLSTGFSRNEYWSGLPCPPPVHPYSTNFYVSSKLWGSVFSSFDLQNYSGQWRYTELSWVQSLSRVQVFATPWTAARQASLSITNSQSLLRLMSIELVMPSNHLILCHPLLPPLIFPSIRVFSNRSVLYIKWPNYWSFSFSITCGPYYKITWTSAHGSSCSRAPGISCHLLSSLLSRLEYPCSLLSCLKLEANLQPQLVQPPRCLLGPHDETQSRLPCLPKPLLLAVASAGWMG